MSYYWERKVIFFPLPASDAAGPAFREAVYTCHFIAAARARPSFARGRNTFRNGPLYIAKTKKPCGNRHIRFPIYAGTSIGRELLTTVQNRRSKNNYEKCQTITARQHRNPNKEWDVVFSKSMRMFCLIMVLLACLSCSQDKNKAILGEYSNFNGDAVASIEANGNIKLSSEYGRYSGKYKMDGVEIVVLGSDKEIAHLYVNHDQSLYGKMFGVEVRLMKVKK